MRYYKVMGRANDGYVQKQGPFKGHQATEHVIRAYDAADAKAHWRRAHPRAKGELVVTPMKDDAINRKSISMYRTKWSHL